MGLHVAFDIGNVLYRFDKLKFVNKLVEIVNKFVYDINTCDAYLFLERLQPLQDIGVTTLHQELRYKFPFLSTEDLELLIDAWNETLTPNEMMLNLLDNLKSDGVKIALLSNMGAEHIRYLRREYPTVLDNTIQHISCEVGAKKPHKLFFQSFCLDNDDFSNCVYVDDLEENLKAGKKYSFKIYHFELDQVLKLSQSKQKIELDRLKKMIYEKS